MYTDSMLTQWPKQVGTHKQEHYYGRNHSNMEVNQRIWLALADIMFICIIVCNPPLRSGYVCVWNIYWTASAANNSGRGSHVLVL